MKVFVDGIECAFLKGTSYIVVLLLFFAVIGAYRIRRANFPQRIVAGGAFIGAVQFVQSSNPLPQFPLAVFGRKVAGKTGFH